MVFFWLTWKSSAIEVDWFGDQTDDYHQYLVTIEREINNMSGVYA